MESSVTQKQESQASLDLLSFVPHILENDP